MSVRLTVLVAGCLAAALTSGTGSPVWAKGKKKTETVVPVETFESDDLSSRVEPHQMTGERFALPDSDAGHAYRCKSAGGMQVCWLSLTDVPKDLTPYRAFRFRIRGQGAEGHPFSVRILNNRDSYGVSDQVKGLSTKWTTVEFLLPEMRVEDGFDPKKVVLIELLWFDPPAFSFEIDDVQFVQIKGAGGWKYSEKEMILSTFGKKRAKKVKHFKTKHFDIYTDSSAAKKKFPKALEKTYTFVLESLGVPDFKTRLPVYIHQNSQLYFEFCVRYVGWSLEGAKSTDGHGSGRYFTTYYQSPKSDVVTHELTHSIFNRTVGAWGGSWFQEGVAVYVEYLAIKKSPAKLFAPILRKGRHTSLRKFISIDRLVDAHSSRGGSSDVANLYLQAGALFEFLLRSGILLPKTEDGRPEKPEDPKYAKLPKAIFDLAEAHEEGEALAAKVETLFGMSIEELEKAWIMWGSRPPK